MAPAVPTKLSPVLDPQETDFSMVETAQAWGFWQSLKGDRAMPSLADLEATDSDWYRDQNHHQS